MQQIKFKARREIIRIPSDPSLAASLKAKTTQCRSRTDEAGTQKLSGKRLHVLLKYGKHVIACVRLHTLTQTAMFVKAADLDLF